MLQKLYIIVDNLGILFHAYFYLNFSCTCNIIDHLIF